MKGIFIHHKITLSNGLVKDHGGNKSQVEIGRGSS